MDDRLAIWVVYDHPRDYPDHVVVRAQYACADGTTEKSREVRLFPTLSMARRWLARQGLTCLARHPDDDPVIVETWL